MSHCTQQPQYEHDKNGDRIMAYVQFDMKNEEYILTVPSEFIDMDIEAGDKTIMVVFPSDSFVESKHKALKRFLKKCRPLTSQ